MFNGFRSAQGEQFFQRKFLVSWLLATMAHVVVLWLAWSRTDLGYEAPERLEEVEVKSLEIEEAPPEEEEVEEEELIEEEPPPEPTPKRKAKSKPKPAPKPEITNVDEIKEGAEETGAAPEREARGGGGGGGKGVKKKVEKPKPAPKVEEKPKPKPKRKPKPKPTNEIPFDPTVPQAQLPQGAKPAKLAGGVPRTPVYPPELSKQNISGLIVVQLLVDRQGNIRKLQILKKESSVEDDEAKAKWAINKFLKSAVTMIKQWKYQPATYNNIPITVWVKVKIPFKLT